MKLKLKNFSLSQSFGFCLLLFALFALPTSCNQESATEIDQAVTSSSETQEEVVRYEFYLDSKEVPEGTFDPADEKLIVNVTGEKDPKVDGGGLIKIWGFTSEETYIAWGDHYGMPVGCMLEVQAHLSEYAETSGAIEHHERTGEVLPEYEAYCEEYLAEMNCHGPRDGSGERGLGVVFKDFDNINGPNEDDAIIIKTLKYTYKWSWNNEVSRYFTLGLYDGYYMYDNWFFINFMGALWNWGWNTYTFNGPLGFLNDRVSSSILIP